VEGHPPEDPISRIDGREVPDSRARRSGSTRRVKGTGGDSERRDGADGSTSHP
jgi:hypothetical protein